MVKNKSLEAVNKEAQLCGNEPVEGEGVCGRPVEPAPQLLVVGGQGYGLLMCWQCGQQMQQEILQRWIRDVQPLPPSRLNEYVGYEDPYKRIWPPGMVRFHLQQCYPELVKGRGRLNKVLIARWRKDATRDPNLFEKTAALMRLAAQDLDPGEKERLTARLLAKGHPAIVAQVRKELEALEAEERVADLAIADEVMGA